MKICKKCGAKNEDFVAYCSCGTLLDESNTVYAQEDAVEVNNIPTEQNYSYQPTNDSQNAQNAYSNANSSYTDNPYQAQNGTPMYDPYYCQPPLKKLTVSKGKIIAGLIVSILFGCILGIIFAVIALVAYNDYESAVSRGDINKANEKCERVRKFNKLTWIFVIIGIVFSIIVYSIWFVSFYYLINETDNPDDFRNEFYNEFYDEFYDDFNDEFYDDYFEDKFPSYGYDDFGDIVDTAVLRQTAGV